MGRDYIAQTADVDLLKSGSFWLAARRLSTTRSESPCLCRMLNCDSRICHVEVRCFLNFNVASTPPQLATTYLTNQQASNRPSWPGGAIAASRKWCAATLAPQTGWWIKFRKLFRS